MMLQWLGWIIAAYVIGSIPFGVLIGRARGVDIRQHGSRNIGATNVWRVLGRRFGLLCFTLDVSKGVASVLGAGFTCGVVGAAPAAMSQSDMWLWTAAAVSAVLGHMFSLFLRFGGGKGVATAFGAMLGMWPLFTIPALAALLVWILVVRTTRYVSLGSMSAALALPLVFAVTLLFRESDSRAEQFAHAWPLVAITLAMAALVVYRHRGNIGRLRGGEEPKIGTKA